MSKKMFQHFAGAFAMILTCMTGSAMAGEPGVQAESRMVPSASVTGDQPNILIMGEDADRDTVPRHSRVFNRILNALISELSQEGFHVFDETGVGMNISNPRRVRRVDAELISLARRIKRPPIDVIIPFQIYASAKKNAYSDIFDLDVRITGRMLDTQSSRRLGNFEVDMGPRDLDPLPVNCKRECILEHIGKQSKAIAHEVGLVLAKKLAHQSPARGGGTERRVDRGRDRDDVTDTVRRPRKSRCTGLTRDYELVFQQFDDRDITEIEEQLVRLKGFDHIRTIRGGARLTEFLYRSCIAGADLNRKLRQMLNYIDLEGTVMKRDTRYTITRNSAPKRR